MEPLHKVKEQRKCIERDHNALSFHKHPLHPRRAIKVVHITTMSPGNSVGARNRAHHNERKTSPRPAPDRNPARVSRSVGITDDKHSVELKASTFFPFASSIPIDGSCSVAARRSRMLRRPSPGGVACLPVVTGPIPPAVRPSGDHPRRRAAGTNVPGHAGLVQKARKRLGPRSAARPLTVRRCGPLCRSVPARRPSGHPCACNPSRGPVPGPATESQPMSRLAPRCVRPTRQCDARTGGRSVAAEAVAFGRRPNCDGGYFFLPVAALLAGRIFAAGQQVKTVQPSTQNCQLTEPARPPLHRIERHRDVCLEPSLRGSSSLLERTAQVFGPTKRLRLRYGERSWKSPAHVPLPPVLRGVCFLYRQEFGLIRQASKTQQLKDRGLQTDEFFRSVSRSKGPFVRCGSFGNARSFASIKAPRFDIWVAPAGDQSTPPMPRSRPPQANGL
jgi:hypothetical protein